MLKNLEEWRNLGYDRHSYHGDPIFVNADSEDYRVKANSPALKLGFKNFPMDKFGVIKPEYKAEVEQTHKLVSQLKRR